jgi:hypothetical protein
VCDQPSFSFFAGRQIIQDVVQSDFEVFEIVTRGQGEKITSRRDFHEMQERDLPQHLTGADDDESRAI